MANSKSSPERIVREIKRKRRSGLFSKGFGEREATAPEVTELRQENDSLKQLVAELSLKNRVLTKSLTGLE